MRNFRSIWLVLALGAAALPAHGASDTGGEASTFLRSAREASGRGDTLGAIQLLQSAIIHAPADPSAYEQLGELYARTDQADLAQKYFGIALDIDPANPPALKGMALLDLAAGNHEAARVQHDRLVRACGANCPEAAQVEKALNETNAVLDRGGSAN